MKKLSMSLALIVIVALKGSDSGSTDWVTSAADIEQALATMSSSLLADIDCFNIILQNVNGLVDTINQLDDNEQQLFSSLEQDYNNLINNYNQVVQAEQDVQTQNAANVAQLNTTLSNLQASTQAQLAQLNQQYADAQNLLNQLNGAYADAVQDNSDQAQAVLTLLRYICDTYSTMIIQKEACLSSLNDILTALNTHIQNESQRITDANSMLTNNTITQQ
jgi:DNA repair exonuclease SbcCD ATPase subunit